MLPLPLRQAGLTGFARSLDIAGWTDVAGQPPERLPRAVVLMAPGAQFAEHELRGIEGRNVAPRWQL